MSDVWKRRKEEVAVELLHPSSGNDSPVVKYFYRCRPDLEGILLESQYKMFKDLTDLHILYHVISCGRGFGKTMIAGAVGLYFADEYSTKIGKPINVLIVSSQKALYDNIGVFFRNRPDLTARLRIKPVHGWIPQEGAEFKDNHSRLIPAMATIHSVEGNRADVIIIDEAQDVSEEVILKAMGCLKKDVVGKLIIIGTPYTEKKGRNWFIELVKNPKTFIKMIKFHLSQHSSDITGGWNDTKLWKATWSKERWNAECLGQVTPSKEKSYFGSGNVNKCYIDCGPEPEGGKNSTREVGIDCGYHNTTYFLTEKIGSVKRKLLFIAFWKDKSIEEIAQEIGSLINQHDPIITKIDSKTGSIADYYKEIRKYTRKPMKKVDASLAFESDGKSITTKDCMRGQLLRKVREGNNLIIPQRLEHANLLIDQMLKYNTHRSSGDDLVDGLMLSCYEPPKGSGGKFGRITICSKKPITYTKKVGKYGL